MDKDEKKSVTYSKGQVRMASSKSIPISKTLNSISSIKQDESSSNEFKRSGILLMAKSDAEGGNGDLLISGTLTLSIKSPWQVAYLEWTPSLENEESESYGSSLPSEWTLIHEQLNKRNVRPIEFELCELKSFKLSDDGNRMVLIQRDGTRHPPLIFLDQGPEELIDVMKKHYCVKQSLTDENLYLLSDARMEALDRSLSQLNLFDKKNTDAVWKFVNDFQSDPYTTALSTFSKVIPRPLTAEQIF